MRISPGLILFNPLFYKVCDRFVFGSHFAQSGSQFAVLSAVFCRRCAADLNKSIYQNVRNYHQTRMNNGVQRSSHFAQSFRNSQSDLNISIHRHLRKNHVNPCDIRLLPWFALGSQCAVFGFCFAHFHLDISVHKNNAQPCSGLLPETLFLESDNGF